MPSLDLVTDIEAPPSRCFNLSLSVDFLHRYMTDDQRESVRALIARMVGGRVAYGVGMNAAEVSTNWRTHHDHIVIAALAIEGEEGYDSNVYESNVKKLRLFHSLYGSEQQRHFSRRLGLFRVWHALHETAPWGEGVAFGHSDGKNWATGSGGSSLYTVFKYVWPDDALVDYLYRQKRLVPTRRADHRVRGNTVVNSSDPAPRLRPRQWHSETARSCS